MNKFDKTDSLTFLKDLKKETVNLVLTDPPYIISKKTGFESCVKGVERFIHSTEFGEWDKEQKLKAATDQAAKPEWKKLDSDQLIKSTLAKAVPTPEKVDPHAQDSAARSKLQAAQSALLYRARKAATAGDDTGCSAHN